MHRDRLVQMVSDRHWRLMGEGRLLLEQSTFDPASGVAQTTQTLIDGGGQRESRTFSVRVYTATELLAMLERAGFSDAKAYGTLRGRPVHARHAARDRGDSLTSGQMDGRVRLRAAPHSGPMMRISLLALVAIFVLTAPAAGQTPPPNTPPTVPQDADNDGFLDASDQCPYGAGHRQRVSRHRLGRRRIRGYDGPLPRRLGPDRRLLHAAATSVERAGRAADRDVRRRGRREPAARAGAD